MRSYEDFLQHKKPIVPSVGICVDEAALPEELFDFQRHCAGFALEKGRSGIYLDTGLGKSSIELSFAEQAATETGKPSLVLTPLAVAAQMHREAGKFGIEAGVIREQSDVNAPVAICNYDRLEKLNPDEFGAVCLDESSILKSFTGATTRKLMAAFSGYRFKLCASATPAPNDPMELGQQSQFLDVMDSNEMLMRWFTADQTEMGRYRIKGHGERDFYDWMATWSRMAESPDDMGFDGSRFKLPELHIRHHQCSDSNVIPPDGELFAAAASATTIHDVKRQTARARAELAVSLIDPSGPNLIWVDTDYEANAVRAAYPEICEVRGSMSIDQKEEGLNAFSTGQARDLLSKPSICGFGSNFQHCASMIFVGRTFSYETFYQAVRRCWRFGQTRPVTAHIIIAEGELQTSYVIERKGAEHIRMKRAMREAMLRALGKQGNELRGYKPTHEGKLPSWLSAA